LGAAASANFETMMTAAIIIDLPTDVTAFPYWAFCVGVLLGFLRFLLVRFLRDVLD